MTSCKIVEDHPMFPGSFFTLSCWSFQFVNRGCLVFDRVLEDLVGNDVSNLHAGAERNIVACLGICSKWFGE